MRFSCMVTMPALDLDLVRTLVLIAEEKNFTRAAERVGRTQSAVSLQVQRLGAHRASCWGLSSPSRGCRCRPASRRLYSLTFLSRCEQPLCRLARTPLKCSFRTFPHNSPERHRHARSGRGANHQLHPDAISRRLERRPFRLNRGGLNEAAIAAEAEAAG